MGVFLRRTETSWQLQVRFLISTYKKQYIALKNQWNHKKVERTVNIEWKLSVRVINCRQEGFFYFSIWPFHSLTEAWKSKCARGLEISVPCFRLQYGLTLGAWDNDSGQLLNTCFIDKTLSYNQLGQLLSLKKNDFLQKLRFSLCTAEKNSIKKSTRVWAWVPGSVYETTMLCKALRLITDRNTPKRRNMSLMKFSVICVLLCNLVDWAILRRTVWFWVIMKKHWFRNVFSL